MVEATDHYAAENPRAWSARRALFHHDPGHGHCWVKDAQNVAQLRSVVGHSVFGLGMYVAALLIAATPNPAA